MHITQSVAGPGNPIPTGTDILIHNKARLTLLSLSMHFDGTL